MFLVVYSLFVLLHGSLYAEYTEPTPCDGTYTTLRQLAKQEVQIASLEEKISKLDSILTGLGANSKCPYVAFRAQLTKDLGTVQRGQIIIFDNVELNIGNAYHPFLGVFTAPCNGTYLFSIKMGNLNRGGALHLKKNSVTVENVWAGYNAGWDMGAVATVLNLAAGDDVWVAGREVVSGTSGNDGIGDLKHVGFSGTLLHAF